MKRSAAQLLFDKVKMQYQSDIVTSSGKQWDQWRDYASEIMAGEPMPPGDCEDAALTWGSLAYRAFMVARVNILLIRGKSPQCRDGVPFDHAWMVVCKDNGEPQWAFDIHNQGPVDPAYHHQINRPYDYLSMADPLAPKMWENK